MYKKSCFFSLLIAIFYLANAVAQNKATPQKAAPQKTNALKATPNVAAKKQSKPIVNPMSNTKHKSVEHPSWSINSAIYEVNLRQYADDASFKNFTKELPRLKKMGINILWFMPIHPIGKQGRKGTLGSYYAVQNYKEINPEFGTADEFKVFMAEAHKLGFKVILDWVANHTSPDNVWVKQHPDFYTKNKEGKFMPPVEDWSDVIDLNYNNTQLRTEMIESMKYWISNFDVDGFRCDVAEMVPTDFWVQCRTELDKVKPEKSNSEKNTR